jgi:hypothetical protein
MALMNHLVFVDAQAGELERILSGVKTMLVREFDPMQTTTHPVKPGDSLYFLKDKDDSFLRVKATIVRVLFFTRHLDEDLSHTLKELQPKLQLTEEQYNHWLAKQSILLIEFDAAQKIGVIHVALEKMKDKSGWIAFEDFSLVV